MSTQKSRRRFVCCGALFIFSSMVMTQAGATPSSGLALSDWIVGTTPKSYFVIRTTTLRPPSYYEYSKRVELLEFSFETRSVESRCLIRETAFETDPNAPSSSWVQTELMLPACEPFEILSQKGANYIEPESVGPHTYKFQLSQSGLSFQETETEDPGLWAPIYGLDDLRDLAARSTSVDALNLPWQTGTDAPTSFSIIGTDEDYEPIYDTCTPGQSPLSALRLKWQFLHIVCWSGNDDSYGANFYVPIPDVVFGFE